MECCMRLPLRLIFLRVVLWLFLFCLSLGMEVPSNVSTAGLTVVWYAGVSAATVSISMGLQRHDKNVKPKPPAKKSKSGKKRTRHRARASHLINYPSPRSARHKLPLLIMASPNLLSSRADVKRTSALAARKAAICLGRRPKPGTFSTTNYSYWFRADVSLLDFCVSFAIIGLALGRTGTARLILLEGTYST